MKKSLMILLVLAMCLSFGACSTNKQQSTTRTPQAVATQPNTPTKAAPTQAVPTQPTPTQPAQSATIELTPENITDYLIFTCKAGNVIKEDKALGKECGKCTINFTTAPKKRGDFDGVTLTIHFNSGDDAWGTLKRTIQLPFDGKSENSYNITSMILDHVTSYPGYTYSIVSVTGSFIPG